MNRRGQALIESLIVAIVLIFSLGFFLRFALKMQSSLVADEFIEQALLCLLSQKTSCESNLRQQMTERGYQNVQIQSSRIQNKYNLRLQALSPFKDHVEKESELEYDLSIAW